MVRWLLFRLQSFLLPWSYFIHLSSLTLSSIFCFLLQFFLPEFSNDTQTLLPLILKSVSLHSLYLLQQKSSDQTAIIHEESIIIMTVCSTKMCLKAWSWSMLLRDHLIIFVIKKWLTSPLKELLSSSRRPNKLRHAPAWSLPSPLENIIIIITSV